MDGLDFRTEAEASKGEVAYFRGLSRYNGLATKDQLNAYKRLIDCISLDADQFPGDWVKKNSLRQPPFQC